MSDLLAALTAAQAAQPLERSTGAASVPVPGEQVAALVTLIRQKVAAGQGGIVTIPLEWWREPDGVTCKPWAPKGNPAQGYAEAVRKQLCKARGGDGTAVWVSQYSALGAVPEGAPEGTKRPIVGAGLEIRDRIPASAKNIPADLAHLVG